MVLDFKQLIVKYNLDIKGIIHIGAHIGQEYSLYKEKNIKNILFFEPVLETYNKLLETVKNDSNVICINKALGNDNKKILMNIETINSGQSSSILIPDLHLKQYPEITFNSQLEVSMIKLDDFEYIRENYNFINIDVQGYELEVFKGAEETLKHIDYIISEVNNDEVYKNCAKIWELDEFLGKYNFKRVETDMVGKTWGDALYIKNK